MSLIPVNGKEVEYTQTGSGRDLLLLHSLLTDATVFERVLPQLASDRRVTCVNLPGFGASAPVALASSGRAKALAEGIVAATELAARATRESYELGRAQLVAVLDAEKSWIDARGALIDAQAARAHAWIDVQLALGAR